jgi:hypothetical protein
MIEQLEQRVLYSISDTNADFKVDLTDFTTLAVNFNKAAATKAEGDFNADGNVDLIDFTYLAVDFNKSVTPTALTITSGGTYTGNFSSIKVRTTNTVIIEDSIINNPSGPAIDSIGSVNLVVRRTLAKSGNSDWFVHCDGFSNVVIQNNSTISKTDGVLLENGVNGASAKVLQNTFTDIVGPYEHGNAVMLASSHNIGYAEIGYNRIINAKGISQTEDNINIYDTTGNSTYPIWIHDNLVWGAYPPNPTSSDFSGGGIIADYKANFVKMERNVVLNTTNYGMQIAAGHDNSMVNNTVVMDELLPATNVGYSLWNGVYKDPLWANNGGSNNKAYMVNNNPWWTPDKTYWTNNIVLSKTTALAQRMIWETNLQGMKIGA